MSEIAPPLTNPLIENDYFHLSSDGTYYIVGEEYNCSGCPFEINGHLDIPAEYNGKPVKKIGNFSFEGSQGITSVHIPDSVTTINNYAFSNCRNLTSINIPDNLISINEYAFNKCIKLNYIDINNVTCCGAGAFQMVVDPACNGGQFVAPNSSLETVILGKKLTYINWSALMGCDNLKSLVIPESVNAISTAAMAYCIHLKNVIIKCEKNSLTLYDRIFDNCPLLEKIYVIDGKGWNPSDTIDGKPIEILPEGGATVAKNMTVKSMVFA